MKILTASLSPEQTYKLMTGIVVPRPIAWITTQSENGVINVAPFSCYTIVSNKPPMIGVNIGRKAGARKDTGKNIHDAKEFVVNIASEDLLLPMHQSAIEYDADVSEVDLLGLHTLPSEQVATPRLAAVPVSMECLLHSITPFGQTGAEFYVGEVVALHIQDDIIRDGKIETTRLRPICRLGGPNYAHLGEIITLQRIQQTEKAVMQGTASGK
ncbi:flavin reductase family protein [Pusillimonas sp. SM2304]|uniref:flavin reductase family protein n=1 Tax=Pusillimonas sp. SM2304 TaxID=3073241 RepID=UPI002876E301|nr:flavin reductase family protein [Pusillimonas sp. SM2304]MDS1140175.1 flavin reductase family protein [Pusillimonas sp. SM2304]